MEPHVGLLTVELCITDAMTLKDKRQVVRSLLGRIGDRFNASVAEVGSLDSCRHASLAFACVSNDGKHAAQMLAAILRVVEAEPRAVVEASEVEML